MKKTFFQIKSCFLNKLKFQKKKKIYIYILNLIIVKNLHF